MAETAKERVIAAHGSLSASINTRMLSVGSFEVTIGHAEVFGVGVGVTESIAERLAWDNAASTLPPTAADPSIPDPWNQKHTVTAAEPSEPKADGFDVWAESYFRKPNEYDRDWNSVLTARESSKVAYQNGEQSGVRKGMQRALEAVRCDRLLDIKQPDSWQVGYIDGLETAERAITAELAKEQQ